MPFTEDQFFDLFARYNQAIWPMQVLAYGLGLAALVATIRWGRHWAAASLIALAALWAFTGVGYHALFFSSINPIAAVFSLLFALEAALLCLAALRYDIEFGRGRGLSGVLAWAMIVYSMVLYPLLNSFLGHDYPRAPTFGVTPCPLLIFTFGVLALSCGRAPWLLFAIPFTWSLIGGSAAFLLGVPADWALPLAAVAAAVINYRKSPGSNRATAQRNTLNG